MPRPATKLYVTASGRHMARKRIPDDVQDEYERLYGKRSEERFVSEADQRAARRAWHEWRAEIDGRIANIRAARKGEGISLTKLQARALSGEWYRWWVAKHGALTNSGDHWDRCRDAIQRELQDYAPFPNADGDLTWAHSDEARENVRPMLADVGETAQFLAARKLTLSADGRKEFLDCLYSDLAAALGLLVRRGEGDFSRDTYPQRFPSALETNTALTATELFHKYIQLRKPKPSTVDRWRGVFIGLEGYFGKKAAAAILPEEAQDWIDSLTNAERSATTVRDVWLNAVKTVFGWSVRTKLIAGNPFKALHVTVPKKTTNRDGPAFYADEARTILEASLSITDTTSTLDGAKRWVPWLCAYSGARAGEITQARGADIVERDGVSAIRITPEAGPVKTDAARTVPLHEHLIAQGFLEFVAARGRGPLFYNPDSSGRATDPTNPSKPRPVKARENIAAWVRSIGVTDKEVQPNHAWRHTFVQTASRCGMDRRVSRFITGHAQESEGDKYGPPTLADMASELKKFPRYATSDRPRRVKATRRK